MKALILYRSHYGNTQKVAELLAAELGKLGHQAERNGDAALTERISFPYGSIA